MQVNITFRHLEPTEALKSHVRGRVAHVQRYIDRPSEAHAVLHVENLHHHAEITVKAGRFLLRGTAKSQDMYASIDAAADKIERQLKKHKEKLHDQKTTAAGAAAEEEPLDVRHDVLDILEHPERPSHRVVKSTKFQAKTMSLDEAILQLDLLDARFYVFQNAGDRAINVVYRRDDGTCGLIEARAG
jgi:putative sigma-54 modulation protein